MMIKRVLTSTSWRIAVLTGLGIVIGLLTLVLSAVAYLPLDAGELFHSYFYDNPRVAMVNLLPPVGLIFFGWFLTRRGWAAYLLACLPCMGAAVVNYFKISLRSDPLLCADLLLFTEAKDMVGGYDLPLTPVLLLCLACALGGLLVALPLLPKSSMARPERAFGLLSAAAVLFVMMTGIYLPNDTTGELSNAKLINPWSDVEQFVSKGTLYSFLHSARDMFPEPPAGYDPEAAAALLSSFTDADIPEDKKISVMAVMLEAFIDLTDIPALAAESGVSALYAPWHELEAESIHGNLLTNIFAGGTVDTEWGFLTGYSAHDDFRTPTDSFVWYLREQGYQTFYDHPGHSWFYNRQNVNEYLGFESSRFTENYYGTLVDPEEAIQNSDHILFPALTEQLEQRMEEGPCFSFSVSYQNHGPYDTEWSEGAQYVTGLDSLSNTIFTSYLRGLKKTMDAVFAAVEELRKMDKPVVLVLFGDHKPWGGNGNSAYEATGISFDLKTKDGFYHYYATPYLIWANPAARDVMGHDCKGIGRDISPCFLMAEVFDQCGWEGDAFLQLQRRVREVTPLLHIWKLYLRDGTLTRELSTNDTELVETYQWAEYFREKTGK